MSPDQEEEKEGLCSFFLEENELIFDEHPDGLVSFRVRIYPDELEYGTCNDKTLELKVTWPQDYPSECPVLELSHNTENEILPKQYRKELLSDMMEEAEAMKDEMMCIALISMAKERLSEWQDKFVTTNLWERGLDQRQEEEKKTDTSTKKSKKKVPKEKLSKKEKNRRLRHIDGEGKYVRGWNWVNVIQHLSQTGSMLDSSS